MTVTVEELERHLDGLRDEARSLFTAAELDGRQDFTDEEEAHYQDVSGRIDAAKRNLRRLQDLEEEEGRASRERAWSGRAPTRPETGGGGNPTTTVGFRSFGEFLQAVAYAELPGRSVDRRLLEVRAASGANESSPADGGFLVGTDYSTDLLRMAFDTGLLVSRVTHTAISANSNGLKLAIIDETSRVDGSRWGGVQAYWQGEADEKIASRPRFAQLELTLKKLTGLFYATDELLQDASALEDIARQAFASEFGYKLDDAILRGTGGGMPLGILESPALTTVAIEAGQTALTPLLYENVVKMWGAMPYGSRRNAIWVLNQELEPSLNSMSLTVGTGGVPVYLPAGGLAVAPNSTLFGRPVIPMEQASDVGDVGDIILMDPTQYRMIDKGGLQSASSIHVRFVFDETTFRWVLRTDGAPSWRTAVTPAHGTNPISPFIALAARS